MDNSERFGIWRRYALRRIIDSNPKKLSKIFKKFPKASIDNFITEIGNLNQRGYQLHQFYKNLPMNYHYYQLLNDIIPLRKFLTPTESFLLPEKEKGTIQFKRKNAFLDMYTKMQYKLHQNEPDLSKLFEEVKTRQEKSNYLLFNKNFLTKPITLEDFKKKNTNSLSELNKTINSILTYSDSDLRAYANQRKNEAEKVNKGAGIPEHLKHKFLKFQNLLNRTVGTFIRENFHKSLAYLTGVFDRINNKIKEEHDYNFENFVKYNKLLKERQKNKNKKEKEEKEENEGKDEKNEKETEKEKNKESEPKEDEEPKEELEQKNDEITENQEEEELKKITMKELLQIRDDYSLEQIFAKDFSILQFSFELKCENKYFALEPDFHKFWSVIEKHIRNSLNAFKLVKDIRINSIFEKDERLQYLEEPLHYLTIFFPDDESYEVEIQKLKESCLIYLS